MRSHKVITLILAMILAAMVADYLRQIHFRKVVTHPKELSNLIYANPDYYDYIHYIDLQGDGGVKLCAGAGQVIHFSAEGNYTLDTTNGTLALFNLKQMNPYTGKQLGLLPSRTNRFKTEKGSFAMREETVWKLNTPDEAPVVVFRERYIFESDPLGFAAEPSRTNLYYITEKRDLDASERIYYPSRLRERMTLADAKRKDLKMLSKAEQLGITNTSPAGTHR